MGNRVDNGTSAGAASEVFDEQLRSMSAARSGLLNGIQHAWKPSSAMLEGLKGSQELAKTFGALQADTNRTLGLLGSVARHHAAMTERMGKLHPMLEQATRLRSLLDAPVMLESLRKTQELAKTFGALQADTNRTLGLMGPFARNHAAMMVQMKNLGPALEQANRMRSLLDTQVLPIGRIFADAGLRSLAPHFSAPVDHWLKSVSWPELEASIEATARSFDASPAGEIIDDALAVSSAAVKSGIVDVPGEFQNFSRNIFQRLDPLVALSIILTIVFAIAAPYWDFYVKDKLSKSSQDEDRRALAKQIASELRNLDLHPAYLATRRVVMKALVVHLNPKTLSPVVGHLRMAEVVTEVNVRKDWTLVTWKDGNGHEMSGWVYTRHLEPLQRH